MHEIPMANGEGGKSPLEEGEDRISNEEFVNLDELGN